MEQECRYAHLNEEVEPADISLSQVSIMVTSNSHYLCFKGLKYECDRSHGSSMEIGL